MGVAELPNQESAPSLRTIEYGSNDDEDTAFLASNEF